MSIFLISSCQCPYRLQRQKIPQTPIFIEMPINNHVAESLGPLLYDAMIGHFQQRGYVLTDSIHKGYRLCTQIKSLSISQRFISQDIVLLNKLTELIVTCSLYNFCGELLKEKTFVFETIIPKSQLPLQQNAYTKYYVQQMLEYNLNTIEQVFKPYL